MFNTLKAKTSSKFVLCGKLTKFAGLTQKSLKKIIGTPIKTNIVPKKKGMIIALKV
jgi:hypothetical protein